MEYSGVGFSRVVCLFACLFVFRWQGLKQWIMRKFNIQNDKLLQQRASGVDKQLPREEG